MLIPFVLTSFAVEQQIERFINELRISLADSTFVKLTLSNYKGSEEHLQKIFVRRIETKKGPSLMFQFRRSTNDKVQNFELSEAPSRVKEMLSAGFRSGHLFTTKRDFQLTIGNRSMKLDVGKPTFRTAETKPHDREKKYRIDPNTFYLKALGITTDTGEIRSDQRDKWKQINKFVEILDSLYENSDLKNKPTLNIVDMGSGKGYLTFAAYDYFGTRTSPPAVSVTGIETRGDLVDLCNQIARAGGFDGLKFVQGSIADFKPGEVDILIALHACDTATDDALYKGITSHASIIVAAPCCHKEVKKQMRSPEILSGILKHPVMLERTAETLTDGIRSMLLEANGYKTKLFEFISTEHTPKNNMIVATRSAAKGADQIETRIDEIRNTFGIEHQHLADLLKQRED